MAVATAALGVAEHLPNVLATILGLLVVVSGGWFAVTRTGLGRTAAAVVGPRRGADRAGRHPRHDAERQPGCSSVAVLGAVVRRQRPDRAAPLGAGARREADAGSGPVAPPARQPVLLINPRSGGAKAERYHLVDECRARGIETIVLQPGDDLVAAGRGRDRPRRRRDRHGRRRRVAGRSSRRPRSATTSRTSSCPQGPGTTSPSTSASTATTWSARSTPTPTASKTGSTSPRSTAGCSSTTRTVGLYAKVVQSPEYRDAKRSTVTSMLPELLGPDAEPLDLRFHGPDGSEHTTANVILVSNDPYQLDLRRGGGTRERLDRGILGIAALRISSAAELARFVALEATRRADRFPGWLEWTAPEFRIDSGGPVEIGVDGEALRLEPPLRVRDPAPGPPGPAPPPGRSAARPPRSPCTCSPGPRSSS